MELKAAGAQICVRDDDINANYKAIMTAIEYAASEKADILLTPEGSLSGYHNQFCQHDVSQALQDIESKAREYRLGLALGTCYFEDDGLCYNQIRFYDTDGRYLGFHSKTLNCGDLSSHPKGEIEYFSVKPLETFTIKGVPVAGLICNDMWANPMCTPSDDAHLSQQLSRMGAHVIFHAVNGGRDTSHFSQVVARNFHESNLLMRAVAGKIWIVTVDNAHPADQPNSCSGGVVTPAGEWAIKMPQTGEHYFTYSFDPASLRGGRTGGLT